MDTSIANCFAAMLVTPALTENGPESTTKTIRQQDDCHTVYEAGKNPWNLEAHRTARNNWLISPKLCNW